LWGLGGRGGVVDEEEIEMEATCILCGRGDSKESLSPQDSDRLTVKCSVCGVEAM